MRLIKPTTLLLLMAITCGTGSPQVGSNGASGGSGAPPTKEQICITQNCQAALGNCYQDPKCKQTFECGAGAKGNLSIAFKCGVDPRARAIIQCGANAGCFNVVNTCPTLLGLSPKQAKFPNLVEQMTPFLWYAVATDDNERGNYFNFGCNQLAVEGSNDTKNGVGIAMSVCGKKIEGGGCDSQYFNFSGKGNQIGNTGAIKVTLKSGPFVIEPSELTINVVGATNEFAVVSSCLAGPNDVLVSKKYAIFARFKTYKGALAQSGNATNAEQVLKYVLKGLGLDLSNFHEIDQSLCKS